MTWTGGTVSTTDTVDVAAPLSGARLRDAYVDAVRALTFGLGRYRDHAVVLGPLTLLRFGRPAVTRTGVEWPIEGGLLAGSRGGSWRVHYASGRVEATVTAFRPSLPPALYAASQLQVHQLFTRLFLLRLRGRATAAAAPGPSREDRLRAASVDVAFCLTLARLTGPRRVGRTLAVAALYHVVCWTVWGRTLGGVVMHERVLATDGTRATPQQSLLRLALVPLSWFSSRAVHDEIAQTDVVTG